MGEAEAFDEFVRGCSGDLLRAAWLLTGDYANSQDLVQGALVKTWQHWESIRDHQAAPAYARRVMTRLFLSMRRRSSYREILTAELFDSTDAVTRAVDSDLRVEIARAIGGLSKRQRTVIVMRYLLDLSEADTANAMGCSIGSVKTHHARALAALKNRESLYSLTHGG